MNSRGETSSDLDSCNWVTVNSSVSENVEEAGDSNKELFDVRSQDKNHLEIVAGSSGEGDGDATQTTPTNPEDMHKGRKMEHLNVANVIAERQKLNYEKMPKFNATSTPLLSSMRRGIPAPLDITAINEEDSDGLINADDEDSDSPLPLKRRTKMNIIFSDESDEDENLMDFIKEHGNKEHQSLPERNGSAAPGSSVEKHEFFELSAHIADLRLGENKLINKPFKFKAPTGNSQTQKKPLEATSSVEIVFPETSDEEDHIVVSLTDEEDETPQFIKEVPSPQSPAQLDEFVLERSLIRNDVTTKKNKLKSLLDIHSRKLGSAKSSAPTSDVLSYRGNVEKTIQHLVDTIQNIPSEDARASPPPGLKVDLYDHQSYGLEWLHWRENQFPGGGILADEMGLGKTLMMISLILRGKVEPASENPWVRPNTARSKLVPSKSTLVIVPPTVLSQWESEISSKSSRLRVNVYHGPNRTTSPAVLVQSDIVLSSYQTVSSEISLAADGWRDRTSPLERVHWHRIILDEGHIIRNCKTNSAKALYKLEASHRWIVTGTPVHNRPSDMQSLIKFLRLQPFDDLAVWDYWIGLKVVKPGNMPRLNTIGKALILRRTKDEVKNVGGKVGGIVPKHVTDVKITMGQDHRQVYEYFKNYAESQFRCFLEGREAAAMQQAANNYIAGRKNVRDPDTGHVAFSTILVLMLRMRQVSVLPYLTSKMIPPGEDDDDLSSEYDPLNDSDLISHKNPAFAESFISAKLAQLFQDLEDIKSTCLSDGRPMDKVIVVSQWTTLLKIVETHLRYRGYSLATISGEVKLEARADIVKRFNSESRRPQVLLLSLAAGGVGLNLVGGNHMIFLDVHYNPQLELQAQDRIHRFGQTKEVYIRRYVCADSMEERVVELQATKLELSKGLLSSTSKKGASGVGLTLQDIRKLFEV